MNNLICKKVILIEDHLQALYEWKKHGFKNLPLVHLDAHIDFGFQEVKNERLILQEARNMAELKTQLEKTLLFKKYNFEQEKLTHIGNYIYPAMRDGVINEFFWVIPGRLHEFKKCACLIKRMLKRLKKQDPFIYNRIWFKPGIIKTKLYNKSFYICILENLPKIKNPVLLDIDTDFLVVNSLKNADATKHIGKRKPWIMPDKLVSILRKKTPNPQFITIAYSVNGGFTPIVYKTIGDQIASCFGYSDPKLKNRILAGEYFKNFRKSLNKEDFKAAKHYYLKALKLNPKYRESDNNYGLLYLKTENYTKAEKEFTSILEVDKNNSFGWSGLGKFFLVKKKFNKAKKCFKKALMLDKNNKDALIGLAETEFKLENYSNSKFFISRYEKLEPIQGFSRYLLGQIYEKENKPRKSLTKYKEALQLGLNKKIILSQIRQVEKKIKN